MVISLKKLKHRLLANSRVKAEYDALEKEFEASSGYDRIEPIRKRTASITER